MLSHKSAIITGASQGLGLAIAKKFVSDGANVLLCARNEGALGAAKREIQAAVRRPEQQILTCAADVSVPEQADRLIAKAVAEFSSLDILVNNAAIQGPIGVMEQAEWRLWRETLEVDLLGPAYLIYRILPVMKRQRAGKIINLSGGGAAGPRANYSAYAVAKTGLVRLTETLAQETAAYGIDINAVAPGAMNSQMLEETLAAGEAAVGSSEYAKALRQKKAGGTPPEVAAGLCAYLASERGNGISGRLISAVWDDWKRLDMQRAELADSDIYTLRRVLPQKQL